MPTLNAFNSAEAHARRQRVLLEAQGVFAESTSRTTSMGGSLTISGTVYYMGVPLLAGDVVSTMYVGCTAVVASGSLTKVGLYTKAQALVASSADVTSSFSTTGLKTIPLTAQSNGLPYVVPADDLYYVAVLGIHAGTAVSLLRTTASLLSTMHGALPNGSGLMGAQVSQVDLPTTGNMSFNQTPIWYWVGLA